MYEPNTPHLQRPLPQSGTVRGDRIDTVIDYTIITSFHGRQHYLRCPKTGYATVPEAFRREVRVMILRKSDMRLSTTRATRDIVLKAGGERAFERHRDNNLRRLLAAASRALNRHITEELHRRGYEDTRPGHAALLANLDFAGNSVTEIAERAQISKQAMARLAVELEEMGIISRNMN